MILKNLRGISTLASRVPDKSPGLTAGVTRSRSLAAVLLFGACASGLHAAAEESRPWMNKKLSPDARAALLEKALKPEERDSLLHGMFPLLAKSKPADAMATGGYVPGVPRLGVPAVQETDASLGVANPSESRKGDGATSLPSGQATAASFDPALAYQGGAMIGQEARKKGFAVLLAGGVNLARDPRGGRNFEYAGEDPLLAGTIVGEAVRGIQDQRIVSTVKHYVLNDQETGRFVLDAQINPPALRESDLLAFELAIERGDPGSVMCSYNKINGVPACADRDLLSDVLKRDWHYPGWVMSDWGAVADPAAAAAAGLDQESGQEVDQVIHKHTLQQAIDQGQISDSRRNEMAHRILRTLFAKGVMDDPPQKEAIDYDADARVAQHVEEAGAVLLKNADRLLPFNQTVRRIAIIGGHADTGVLSGGGSSQVIPVGGASLKAPIPKDAPKWLRTVVYHPSSPMKAIAAARQDLEVNFDAGTDPTASAALAARADVVIVFATQWLSEEYDAWSLSLPSDQDKLIEAVAAANPRTVVVLETGGPILMPWLDHVGAVLETWFPGSGGGEAIARILFGQVNPSGRLPVTFPASEDQLPRPVVPGSDQPRPPFPGASQKAFEIQYNEGADVGYRWFSAKGLKPLFPFGFGLSYTRFEHKILSVRAGTTIEVQFDVTNVGERAGADTVQLYADLPSAGGQTSRRLIGWCKAELQPGERKRLTIKAEPRVLADFDAKADRWRIRGGPVSLHLATDASDEGLTATVKVKPATLEP